MIKDTAPGHETEPQRKGLMLIGPPGAGKDTVTEKLHENDQRFELFKKLKLGNGRTNGHRMITREEYQALRETGEILHVAERLGNQYAVDRTSIEASFDDDAIPVVHTSSTEDMRILQTALPGTWTTVLLWIDRAECESRLIARGDKDVNLRLSVWDDMDYQLMKEGYGEFGLICDNVPLETSVAMIRSQFDATFRPQVAS